MENNREKIIKMCLAAGAEDAKIVRIDDMRVAVLFFPYNVYVPDRGDIICVSGYYEVSNKAYSNVKRLCSELRSAGIYAKHDTELPAKTLAFASGGKILKNGLYCHPFLGSNVHLQIIILQEGDINEFSAAKINCMECGKCITACPAGAISEAGFNRDKCIREHIMGSKMDDNIKKHIYQLFGCEKCQICCPENNNLKVSGGNGYYISGMLEGRYTSILKEKYGKNVARQTRIINQSIIIAANNKRKEIIPLLNTLKCDGRFYDACRYAILRLTGRPCV